MIYLIFILIKFRRRGRINRIFIYSIICLHLSFSFVVIMSILKEESSSNILCSPVTALCHQPNVKTNVSISIAGKQGSSFSPKYTTIICLFIIWHQYNDTKPYSRYDFNTKENNIQGNNTKVNRIHGFDNWNHKNTNVVFYRIVLQPYNVFQVHHKSFRQSKLLTFTKPTYPCISLT